MSGSERSPRERERDGLRERERDGLRERERDGLRERERDGNHALTGAAAAPDLDPARGLASSHSHAPIVVAMASKAKAAPKKEDKSTGVFGSLFGRKPPPPPWHVKHRQKLIAAGAAVVVLLVVAGVAASMSK